MHRNQRGPQDQPEFLVDTAIDRRRPNRPATVSEGLVRLLRGQSDPDAPADPVVRRPRASLIDAELVLGAAIATILILTGTVVSFAA